MMTKYQIASELEEMGFGKKNQIKNILDGLAELAQDEIRNGEDFTVPGICRITWKFRAPSAKGARWKAGDEVVGFGGIKSIKDSDSPVVSARVAIGAAPVAKMKVAPKSTDKTAQRKFLGTKTGKYIASRKAK